MIYFLVLEIKHKKNPANFNYMNISNFVNSIFLKTSKFNIILPVLWSMIGFLPIMILYPTSQSQIGLRDIHDYVYLFKKWSEGNFTRETLLKNFFDIFGSITQFLGIETAKGYLLFIYILRMFSFFIIFTVITKLILDILSNETLVLRLSALIFATFGYYQTYLMFLERIRLIVGLAFYFIGFYFLFSYIINPLGKRESFSKLIIIFVTFILSALIHELCLFIVVCTILCILLIVYIQHRPNNHNNRDFFEKLEIVYLSLLILIPIFLVLFISEINFVYHFSFGIRDIFTFIYLVSLCMMILFLLLCRLKNSKIKLWIETHLSKNIFYAGVPTLLWCTLLLKAAINMRNLVYIFILMGLWFLFLIDTIDKKRLTSRIQTYLIFLFILIILVHSASIITQFWEFGASLFENTINPPFVKLTNHLNMVGNLFLSILIAYGISLSKNKPNLLEKINSSELVDDEPRKHSIRWVRFINLVKRNYQPILIILLILSSIGTVGLISFQGKAFLEEDVILNRELLDTLALTSVQVLENENRNIKNLWDILLVNGDQIRRRMMALTGNWVYTTNESAELINNDLEFNGLLQDIEIENLNVWVLYVKHLPLFIEFNFNRLIKYSEFMFTVGENAFLIKLVGSTTYL